MTYKTNSKYTKYIILALLICILKRKWTARPGILKNDFSIRHNVSRIKKTHTAKVETPIVGKGAKEVTGAITGGLIAGSLHAITGPDHLAALLPRCCGQRWFSAGEVGVLWGMGHSISTTLLGVAAFFVKRHVPNVIDFTSVLSGASHLLEIAVGVSLVIIGILGIMEAREWRDEMSQLLPQNLSGATADPRMKNAQRRAVLFNGLLLGFSWDGAPSLAPALAIATWRGNMAFLLAYAFGTMGAMAITTTLVGEGTSKAGQVFNRPDIPQKLSFVSSWIAVAVGVVWVCLALR